MSSRWMQRRKRDQFYRLAKQRGYRSRASFKLLQAVRRYGFMKRGDIVVDLGAAPGGWLQVASEIVGERGLVLGVDIQEIQPIEQTNVQTIVADVTDPSIAELIMKRTKRKADVILSDVSPNLSGVWEIDHARQIHLATRSLEIAGELLRVGGHIFAKAFHGPDLDSFRQLMRSRFKSFRTVKPEASRAESSEIYLLGLSFRG